MKPIPLPIAELKSALSGIGKVINPRTTLPVLQHVKVERTNDGWIALTGTDLDRFVTMRLEHPAEGPPCAVLVPFGQLQQLTRDHSLRNLYQDRPDLIGTLGPATSNVIIRAIGLDANVEIEHNAMTPEHGDIYLLCCDGLNDLVDDWMIREIMTSGDPLEVVAENLVRAANNNGGTDNITVVLCQAFFDTVWAVPQPHYGYQQAY